MGSEAKKRILRLAKELQLPLTVRSTSIFIYNALEAAKMPEIADVKECYEILCVFLGCKLEDIHGHLCEIFESQGIGLEKVLSLEIKAMELLDFNFYYDSPYLQLAGFHILQRKEPANYWKSDKTKLETLLVSSGSFSSLEYAAAAASLDGSVLSQYRINIENVRTLLICCQINRNE